MRGPKPKYPIKLSPQEEQELDHLIRARSTPQGQAERARILLAAHRHPEWSNQQIAQDVGCTDRCVRKWRARWTERQSLADLPRSGAPRRFSPGGASASHRLGL